MNQREFDRTCAVAAQRFVDLLRTSQGIEASTLAKQAWADAEAFDGEAAKREPGDDKPRKIVKQTA